MMSRCSVRVRLTLWNVGVLAVILFALGLVLRYTLLHNLSSQVDSELAGVGSGFRETKYPLDELIQDPEENGAHRSPMPPPRGRLPFPPSFDAARRAFPAIALGKISLLRPRLFLIRKSPLSFVSLFPSEFPDTPWDVFGLRQAASGHDAYTTVLLDAGPFRVLSIPIRYEGRVCGVVQFARPLDGVYHEVNRLTRTLLTLLPFALLTAGIGGAFLTDRALRPVRAVTQAASRIEAADLSGRLAVSGGDEFAELALTFNGMLRRLEEAFGSLEFANEQFRRFTADASHELRTPLTIIKAHTGLSLARPHSADEYRAALEIVDRAVDRTTCLVQDLLLLARSDAGQQEMPRGPVAVTEILEYALQGARQSDSPPVRMRLPDPPPTVFGNADALIRLVSNLVANAVRHTPKDGAVTLSASERGSDVVIEVADTGEGIAPEHLPHVRERFYRADESRSRPQGGTGLGLSICQSIVDAHGGGMEIRSVLDVGTTVIVTLPGVPDG